MSRTHRRNYITAFFASAFQAFGMYHIHALADITEGGVLGALFIGIGAGICVRCGATTSGDDALAMSLSKITKIPIQWIYLASDLTVLGLSLTYLPLRNLLPSLLTVILSGQIIGWIQKIPVKKPAAS